MENLWQEYQNETITSVVTMLVLLFTRFLSVQAIRRVGRISDLDKVRTRLIIKYVMVGHTLVFIVALIAIWGVSIRDLGIILSSVFAVIGVALFASWSILSNVTAGVILFFSFPFKIGDRIRVLDKDLGEDFTEFTIEDIRAFHVHLRQPGGSLITYPNNLLLQKAVALLPSTPEDSEGSEAL